MTENFTTLITQAGKEKIAASLSNKVKINLSVMAVGDGQNNAYYEPSENQSALKHECYRVAVSSLIQDESTPDRFIAEAILPEDIGGFYIREVGLYDSDQQLFAISKFPETYKPLLTSGSGRKLRIRLVFKIANTDSVALNVTTDSEIVENTKAYVDQSLSQYVKKTGDTMTGSLETSGHITPKTDKAGSLGEHDDRAWWDISAYQAYYRNFISINANPPGNRPVSYFNLNPQLSLSTDTQHNANFNCYGDTTNKYYISFSKTRGTTGNEHKTLLTGDQLGTIAWSGSNGANYQYTAAIGCYIDGNITETSYPTSISFWTRDPSLASIQMRSRITSDGHYVPHKNNAYQLGLTTHQWSGVYAYNGYFKESMVVGGDRIVPVWNHAAPQATFTSSGNNHVNMNIYGDKAGCYQLTFSKTRGTSGNDHKTCLPNDLLGSIDFSGSNGTKYERAARIYVMAENLPENSYTSRLIFATRSADDSGYVNRALFNQQGHFYPAVDNTYSCGVGNGRWKTIYAANGVIQTSDVRTKTDIQKSALGLDFINQLNPVSYKYKVGGNKVIEADENGNPTKTEQIEGKRTHWGLIAQEVKQAIDEAGVDFGGWLLEDMDDPDSQQALRYDQFIAPLIKATQELTGTINKMTGRIDFLENEINALKAKG